MSRPFALSLIGYLCALFNLGAHKTDAECIQQREEQIQERL